MLEGGYHLILDLEGCNRKLLDSREAMRRLCHSLARIMGARVVQCGSYKFKPMGVTAFAIIEESHISIHTWPESRKAFLDIFTCQELFDGDRVVDYILGFLGGQRGRVTLILRNSLLSRVIFDGRVSIASMTFDLGRTILSLKSPFQRIELTKGSLGLSLFLDGYWQFVEKYEPIYHETLVHPAMVCAPRLRRVGIAGGGDALALREVVKYPQLGNVVMYELDPMMLAVADQHPEMLRLNKAALRHPKARVKADDARKMLVPGANFDVLILDFPSISDGDKFSELYTVPFYRQARQALAPGGILVTQVTDYRSNLMRITENLKKLFVYVIPIDIGIHFSMFNFVLASTAPFQPRRRLPPNLKFITPRKIEKLLHPLASNGLKAQNADGYALCHPRAAL
jgi:spermidine synthase